MSSEARMLGDLRILLLRDLRAFRREIGLFPDDASPWRTVPGIANPAGTLALHAAGNLQFFVGALLGGTGYRRDREAEFGRRSAGRAKLAAELERAEAVVDRTLGALPPQRLGEPFPETLRGLQASTGTILLHLATHLAFHLGQAGYHRRALLADSRNSGAMSVAEFQPRG